MTGLVVEGGGMKCAYSAGILDKFLDDHVTFDYAIGVSAGSANTASYLAGQRDRNKRFYTDHLDYPGYFGFGSFLKTGNLFGLQTIYGDISNSDGIDPIDMKAIWANPARFRIVVTDAETGKPLYYDKDQMKFDDLSIIMASCAIPAACRPIHLEDGHIGYDGGVSDSIPFERAILDGCDKVVVILSKTQDYVKKPEGMKLFYTMMCRKYPGTIEALNHRHEMYGAQQKRLYELEREGKAFIFAPSEKIEIGTFTMNAQDNQKMYDLALQDYEKARADLEVFLR